MEKFALLDSNLTETDIQLLVGGIFTKYGKIDRCGGGMCGSVYFFDQGENVHPRWVAAKVPRAPAYDRIERNRRFLRELEIQHSTYYHEFVSHPFDYEIVYDTPVALYRAMNDDLSGWIYQEHFSDAGRLATLSYLCAALIHCRSRGVLCHQDLKPQNILMRDYRKDFRGLPEEDVYNVPLLADFGLANMGLEYNRPDGPKPYMAPEQWLDGIAEGASDVFSLGVIIYEVMTRGMHPVGHRVSDWWPEPRPGNSKKWQRDDFWKRWAKDGSPISPAVFVHDDLRRIVCDCMSPLPASLPSLQQIQADLLEVLRTVDRKAFEQATFRISYANSKTKSLDDWPYRNQRLDRLRMAFQSD